MFLARFSRPLLARVKEATNIVGFEVVPNAREVLINLYNDMLRQVQVIPEQAKYRQDVEKVARYRLRVCEEEEDWEKIEKRIGCGQVEELIWQAKDEMTLIPKMAEWKPWEVPPNHHIEFVEDNSPVPKHVPTHIQ
ncbi:hypothetical protein CBR_g31069 [Chara braunii]|uniref:NADH dehydrogenase [ubiquinone] 1 alpha subcomplex subunit 5 n=1 Tax=Chara braunii TaxID=69332 RepID=A0A388LE77_CHABU|nr:hypothetical protein CBR_g31069 [Chara braunii]|eukprot:GBG80609.1 hypothetical protein CBR_g31069 [Chara braunii]